MAQLASFSALDKEVLATYPMNVNLWKDEFVYQKATSCSQSCAFLI